MWVVWLVLAGLFFIGEMITSGFLVFWLGVGAVLALLCSFVIDNVVVQIIIFTVSSIVLIFLTKPLTKKFLKNETIVTNAYSLVGKKGIVLEEIDSIKGCGKVKVNGEIWSAKSNEEGIIEKETEIEVLEIVGVKLVVKPCKINVNV